jgi:segregation and condensation protein B
MAPMRLVRDDDVSELELMDEQEQPQQHEPSAEPLQEAPRRSRRKRGAATAAGDEPTADSPAGSPEDNLATEPPDGVIEDAAGLSEDEGDDTSSDVQVDLRTLEALLFSTHHPLTAGRLAEMLELESTKPIRGAIKELNEQYVTADRSFRIEQVAGGYQMLTLPDFGEILKKLHQREVDAKLTKAALETLAIIAYKQPILRADIEAIRGVACGETIRSLMEKHLVKIAGRAEIPGRPILYGTTKRFLELFGLNSVKDLPQGESASPTPPSES